MLLLPTLLQVIFDQAKRLVVIVNIMHSLHLRNKLCLIIKICIFKNHFLVKNKLQTPQLNPYLLVSPHPSRFSPLLNFGHHFYFWNRNKVILGPIWNKDNLFTFHNLENAIWKNSLDSFLLWFSWCDHFACQMLTGIFVLFTELPQIRRRLLTDPSRLNVFHFRFSLANQTSSTSSLVITFVPQMSSDWFN